MFPRFQPHLNRLFLAGGMILLLCIACKAEKPQQPALKTVFQDHFLIGAALNPAHVSGADPRGQALVRRHFNSITPENIVKWERIHPRPGRYHFEPVDSLVDFGEENGMFIVGHTLIWHSQTPAWVFEDSAGNPVSRDTLLQRMRDHIFAVVGRYKGRIQGWDVVNEGVEDDGTWRQTPWRQIIGEDYIAKAFEWAHQADPEAELYYNDFNMWLPGKRDWTVALVKDLKSRELRIDGVGMQGHWGSDWPPLDEAETAIEAYAAAGAKVMITELDLNILPQPDANTGADISRSAALQERLNPWPDGLPDSMETFHARRYGDFFRLFVRHSDAISRVTFWGVEDGHSWLNNWPVRGRTAYPLIFDRQYRPGKAFEAVVESASGSPE